jgi:hypothetical protein
MENKYERLKRLEEASEGIRHFLDEIKAENPKVNLGDEYAALDRIDAFLYNLGIKLNEPDNPPTVSF